MNDFESAAFRAMGTEVEILAAPNLNPDTVRQLERLFEHAEAMFSRFRPDSELSRLNRSAGTPFRATPEFVEVLRHALQWATRSPGLFDPAVLPAVEAAGYRESIDRVRGSAQLQTLPPPPALDAIRISDDGIVQLSHGCAIDLGGFVKGWTVDRAADLMEGLDSWIVNAGGDLLARGPGPGGEGWFVGVEDPFVPGSSLAVLAVRDAALATSSTRRRRWQTQIGEAHHIIDPRTGLPSETDLASVTVLAETTEEAEVTAKVLLLLGSAGARERAAALSIPAAIVDDVGCLEFLGGLEGCVV